MTWTLAGTTTPGVIDDNALWTEVFRTYLNTRTGWTAVEAPDSTSRTLITYTFTDKATNTPFTQYSYHNSQYWRRCSTFNTTPGDKTTDSTASLNLYATNNPAGEIWRIWYSDVNPRAMLVTYGKYVLAWFEGTPEAFISPGAQPRSTWLADGSAPDTSSWWSPAFTDAPYLGGAPHSSGSSGVYRLCCSIQHGGGNSKLPPAMYDNAPIWTTGDTNYLTLTGYSQWMFSINQADVRYHAPGDTNAFTQSSSYGYKATNPGALILSNNRYWLRRNSNLAENSWIFDFGDTEPNFSALP